MAFSINTNIASLQAQEYLRVNQDFQSKTINRVTSGLRIISSGDDAAGLAIANTFRSDRAVLAQGIRNANDGLSTLQTIDGGINNISQLLDRARTLAAQSASGTFTGSRGVLNKEFESVVSEINRQSQAIGLDSGGLFAKSLSVFIGGGRANNGIAATQNGAVGVNLSNSTVDARSLGLKGVQAVGTAGTDIGSGAVGTKVTDISGNTANTDSLKTAGFTDFFFQGPGFGDGSRVKVSVNTAGITDADTLASAVNSAIAGAGNGNSSSATSFRNAGIRASVNTDATGAKQLAFSSSTSAFQVQAGDQLSSALLGKFERNASLSSTVTAATVATNGGGTSADLTLKIDGGAAFTVSVTSGATTSKGQIVKDLNANATFAASATAYLDGNKVVLRSKANSATSSVQVSTATTLSTNLGFSTTAATADPASTGASLATRVQAATETASGSSTFGAAGAGTIKIRFTGASLSSPVDVDLAVGSSSTVAEALTNLQSSIASNSQLADARISLSTASAGNTLVFTSQGGEKFQVAVSGDVQNKLGFGSFKAGAAGEVDYATLQGVAYNPSTSAAGTNAQLQFSIDGAGSSTNAVTVDLTAGDATAASVASSNTSTGVVNVTGNNNKLNLVVNGTNVNVTLTAGARTKSDIADAINTALGANGTAKVSGNAITLESSVKGAGGSIQVLSGTANTDLGFSAAATPTIGASRSGASVAAALNTAFAADTELQAAGLQATFASGKVTVASNNGTNFRLNSLGSTTAANVVGTASDTVAATAGKSTSATASPYTISATTNQIGIAVDGNAAVQVVLSSGTALTAAAVAADLNNGKLTGAILGGSGATASVDATGHLVINSNTASGTSTIAVTAGTSNSALGVIGAQTATAGAAAQTSQFAITGSTNKLRISVDGGTAVDVTLATTVGSDAATLAADAQAKVNAALLAAGQTSTVAVTASGNGIKFASASSGAGSSIAFSTIANDAYTAIGLTSGTTTTGTEANLGYGTSGASFTGNIESSAPTTSTRINSGGAAATQSVAFRDLANGSDDQVVTITANDASGASQSLAVTLRNDATSRSGRSLDESLKAINDSLQQSNNTTLQKIVAVKDNSSGTEKISFSSTLGSFKVSVGTSSNGNGIDAQGSTLDSAVSAGGAVVDISSQQTAEAAVNSLADAVAKLGDAQAVVGRGQNQFNFAISLAQTQLSNLAASESRIRDADLAQEAANLTKAQVLQQAGIAALAQANSAPQAVLSLLRG